VNLGEVQGSCGEPRPCTRCGVPQLRRESRPRQLPSQHLAKGEFASQDVRRYACHVADFSLNLELPILCSRGPAQNLVKVPVDEIDLRSVDR
jgi:hypothetical protein